MKKYKNFTLLSIFLSLFLFLAACGPMYNSSLSFQQPKSSSGKQCVNTCLQNRSTCQMQCSTQNEQCRNNARQIAMPAYVLYVANKAEQEKNPHKTIEDFANYSNCNSSCGCNETYNQCFSNCGGTITENRQCVAFCDKVPSNQLVQSRKIYQ